MLTHYMVTCLRNNPTWLAFDILRVPPTCSCWRRKRKHDWRVFDARHQLRWFHSSEVSLRSLKRSSYARNRFTGAACAAKRGATFRDLIGEKRGHGRTVTVVGWEYGCHGKPADNNEKQIYMLDGGKWNPSCCSSVLPGLGVECNGTVNQKNKLIHI